MALVGKTSFPMPSERVELTCCEWEECNNSGPYIVVASTYYDDDRATVILLAYTPPYFRVSIVFLPEGPSDKYLADGPVHSFRNIVYAVRSYEQMGGDV